MSKERRAGRRRAVSPLPVLRQCPSQTTGIPRCPPLHFFLVVGRWPLVGVSTDILSSLHSLLPFSLAYIHPPPSLSSLRLLLPCWPHAHNTTQYTKTQFREAKKHVWPVALFFCFFEFDISHFIMALVRSSSSRRACHFYYSAMDGLSLSLSIHLTHSPIPPFTPDDR